MVATDWHKQEICHFEYMGRELLVVGVKTEILSEILFVSAAGMLIHGSVDGLASCCRSG